MTKQHSAPAMIWATETIEAFNRSKADYDAGNKKSIRWRGMAKTVEVAQDILDVNASYRPPAPPVERVVYKFSWMWFIIGILIGGFSYVAFQAFPH